MTDPTDTTSFDVAAAALDAFACENGHTWGPEHGGAASAWESAADYLRKLHRDNPPPEPKPCWCCGHSPNGSGRLAGHTLYSLDQEREHYRAERDEVTTMSDKLDTTNFDGAAICLEALLEGCVWGAGVAEGIAQAVTALRLAQRENPPPESKSCWCCGHPPNRAGRLAGHTLHSLNEEREHYRERALRTEAGRDQLKRVVQRSPLREAARLIRHDRKQAADAWTDDDVLLAMENIAKRWGEPPLGGDDDE